MKKVEKKVEKKPAPLTKAELVGVLAEESNLPRVAVDAVLGRLAGIVVGELAAGADLVLPGLGKFQLRRMAARVGFNPHKQAKMKIPAKVKVRFQVSKTLADLVRGQKEQKGQG